MLLTDISFRPSSHQQRQSTRPCLLNVTITATSDAINAVRLLLQLAEFQWENSVARLLLVVGVFCFISVDVALWRNVVNQAIKNTDLTKYQSPKDSKSAFELLDPDDTAGSCWNSSVIDKLVKIQGSGRKKKMLSLKDIIMKGTGFGPLRYKPQGWGFNSRWGNWDFSLTSFFWPPYGPGVDTASNRKWYQGTWNCVYCAFCAHWQHKGKGKSVPLQAWTGPEGSRKLKLPDFMTTAQDGGKVVSLTHRSLFTPRKYSWYWSTPGP